jgi:hypothetical protein
MFVEQLNKKEECMISGFLEEGGVFLFLDVAPFSSLILFIS